MRRTSFGLVLLLALAQMDNDLDTKVFSQSRDYRTIASSVAYQSGAVEDWGINRLIKDGRVDEVRSHIVQGFNVNSGDDFGWTPLLYACLWKQVEVARLLLENGSDVAVQSHQGVSPLAIAVNFENAPLISLLLDFGAPINAKIECGKDQKDQKHQLNYTSKLILNHGAPFLKNNCGDTVLVFSANYCRVKSVSALLERGGDVDGQNEEGLTALMKAGNDSTDANCGAEISGMLLNYSANINAVDHKGYTALMHAVNGKNNAKVEMLLKKGADASITAKDGKTALSLAREIGSAKLTKLISKASGNKVTR